MAVEDKYVNSDLSGGDKAEQITQGGAQIVTIHERFEVAVADDNGSVYRVFRIPSNAIPLRGGAVEHDSITGGTDYEYGLYDEGVGGAEADLDVFLGTTTHANTTAQDPFSLAIDVDNEGKPVWELLGETADTNKVYDWAITANTVGSGAGTISVFAQYLIP